MEEAKLIFQPTGRVVRGARYAARTLGTQANYFRCVSNSRVGRGRHSLRTCRSSVHPHRVHHSFSGLSCARCRQRVSEHLDWEGRRASLYPKQTQFGALTAQAEEVHALSTKVTADMAEPIKARATRKHERSPQGDLASLLAARRAAALGGRSSHFPQRLK